MTSDELAGRMLTMEVLSMASLGLYLANASNDPDLSKARALLDFLRSMIVQKASETGGSQRLAALQYADDLLSQLLENLRLLRGSG